MMFRHAGHCWVLSLCMGLHPVAGAQARASSGAQMPAASASSASVSWHPAEQDQVAVRLAVAQFFRLKDQGNYAAAYAMFSKTGREGLSLERWMIRQADVDTRAGELQNRTINKITWYADPPSMGSPAIYAAIDHVAAFKGLDFYCGMMIWQRQSDGSFQLLREEEHMVDRLARARMSSEQWAAARRKFRC